jgi:hypothetical protein
MAGVAGFEPTHDGVKVRCLTAWLHPNTDVSRLNNQVSIKMAVLTGFEPAISGVTDRHVDPYTTAPFRDVKV